VLTRCCDCRQGESVGVSLLAAARDAEKRRAGTLDRLTLGFGRRVRCDHHAGYAVSARAPASAPYDQHTARELFRGIGRERVGGTGELERTYRLEIFDLELDFRACSMCASVGSMRSAVRFAKDAGRSSDWLQRLMFEAGAVTHRSLSASRRSHPVKRDPVHEFDRPNLVVFSCVRIET